MNLCLPEVGRQLLWPKVEADAKADDRADVNVADSMKSPGTEKKRAAPRSSEARQIGYELDECQTVLATGGIRKVWLFISWQWFEAES